MLIKLYDKYKNMFIFGIISIFIGIIVGIIDTFFGRILILITNFRDKNPIILIPFLSLAGVIIILAYTKIGKNSLKGMTLVFEAGHGEEDKIPKRLIPFAILSTWITHLFGGSAGREGVAVQIGATVAHGIGRKIQIENSEKILLVAGMAAGFSGLFQTPIAAVFFALEVLVAGSLQYSSLFSALIASFTASYTSNLLGLEKFTVPISINLNFNFSLTIKLIICGIIFGAVGGLFAYFLKCSKNVLSSKMPNPLIRIFIIGIILSFVLILLHCGRYCGLGTNLISNSFNNNIIYNYDWILKFILTILTLSAGFQGGEVTPLFSIGASLGIVLSSILGLPTILVAALGYAAVFGSATNTFLSPIFIGAEVFGFEYIPFFFIVCAFAYIFNGNNSIYSAQKKY